MRRVKQGIIIPCFTLRTAVQFYNIHKKITKTYALPFFFICTVVQQHLVFAGASFLKWSIHDNNSMLLPLFFPEWERTGGAALNYYHVLIIWRMRHQERTGGEALNYYHALIIWRMRHQRKLSVVAQQCIWKKRERICFSNFFMYVVKSHNSA